MAIVEFYKDASENPEWRWCVKANNGQILGASCEGFRLESSTKNNLTSLPSFCLPADVKLASEKLEGFKRPLPVYQDRASEWRWRIVAGNGHTTHASSEGFSTKRNAINNLLRLCIAIKEWNDTL